MRHMPNCGFRIDDAIANRTALQLWFAGPAVKIAADWLAHEPAGSAALNIAFENG